MQKLLTFFLTLIVVSPSVSQQSFSLQEAIEYGIEYNRDLEIKKLDIRTAESDIKEFKSIGMPKVTGSVNYQYYFYAPVQPVADFLTPAVYNVLFDENVIDRRDLGPPDIFNLGFFQPHNLNGGVEVSALAFDGSYLVGLKAAKLYKELVAKEVNATEQKVRGIITKAYMAVLISEENIKVIDNNLSVIKKSLRETEMVYKEGFAESLDVDRLTLSYNNLNTEREKLEGLINLSKNLLKFQMNYPMTEDIYLSEGLEKMVAETDVENISAITEYDNRGEFLVINTGQELNALDLERHKKGYLPSVRVFASAQESLQRTNLFDGDEAGWLPSVVAGVGITIPIYDGGEKSAKIQKVKINIERTNLQLEQFKQGVDLQVYNAQIAIANAKKSIANTKRALDINQRIYDKTSIKFKEGVGSSVELTQAENSLYQAQGAYINALYDLIVAKTDLDIAKGDI